MKRCPICVRPFPVEERFCSVHGMPLVEERVEICGEPSELSGHVLDNRYRLAGLIGRGGMGVVYDAEHLRIGRRCAVKVLHRAMTNDAKMRMRLFREVQATSRIRHNNVVEILDYGEDSQAGTYLVMEFIEGLVLTRVIDDKAPLDLAFVCKAAVQLCAALSATHAAGLIHRDLKPGNVIIQPNGQAKVLDFGLIKSAEPGMTEEFFTITTDGMIFGTPYYMSPEHAAGDQVDARSDIYSLGVILYEMLVGSPPFEGEGVLDIIDQHRSKPVPYLTSAQTGLNIPASVEAILFRALAKSPNQRFQTMAELMDAFCGVAEEHGLDLGRLDLEAGVKQTQRLPRKRRSVEDSISLKPLETSALITRLHDVATDNMDRLTNAVVESLRQSFPRFRAATEETHRKEIAPLVQAAVEILKGQGISALVAEGFAKVMNEQEESGGDYPLSEVLAGIWVSFGEARPYMRQVAGASLEKYVALEDDVDAATLAFVFHLAESYVLGSQGRLLHLNEQLQERNKELEELKSSLGQQAEQTAYRLENEEKLAAHVTDITSTGLMLVDRASLRVLLFNPAMEKLSGTPASEFVGKHVRDVIHLLEGVPLEEFLEQARLHGQVGLRKLRLAFPSGAVRSVYVRGNPFLSPKTGQRLGTLFSAEDVTEREQIIGSFARYLSRDVVDRVLGDPLSSSPSAMPRQAVILSARLRRLDTTLRDMSPNTVTRLVSDYVRIVADTIPNHGGTIDCITEQGTHAYFAPASQACGSAASATIELARRLAAVNDLRGQLGQPKIEVGLGLDVGEVLVINAGGDQRMLHTVVGEATLGADALSEAAENDEILVSGQVASKLGDSVSMARANNVASAGQREPLEAFRLLYDTEDLPEPDPITEVSRRTW